MKFAIIINEIIFWDQYSGPGFYANKIVFGNSEEEVLENAKKICDEKEIPKAEFVFGILENDEFKPTKTVFHG